MELKNRFLRTRFPGTDLKGGVMKKILVVLVLAAFIVGCGLVPKPPDIEGIEKLLTEDMEDILTVQPEDKGVTFILDGLPEEFPEGLESINVYVDTFDMTDLPASDLGAPLESEITADMEFDEFGMDNGTEYYFEARGNITGDTVSEMGFGGRFYPRPWGAGSYLGYNPETDPPEEQEDNALFFNHETGHPRAIWWISSSLPMARISILPTPRFLEAPSPTRLSLQAYTFPTGLMFRIPLPPTLIRLCLRMDWFITL
jgi:hypothetical protein